MRKYIVIGIAAFAVATYLTNASWLVQKRTGEPTLISHRGVYKTEELDFLPADYRGALWVGEIEAIGPNAKTRFEIEK